MAYTPFVINEDLSEVQDFGGGSLAPEVPPGDYTFDVVGVEQSTAKSSGNAMIVVTFEVADGEFAGKRVVNRYALTAAAMGRIKRLIMACGGKTTQINSDELMGARLIASVVHNEGRQATNPDGTPKLGADGQPLPPAVFANIVNERPVEAQAQAQTQSAPPPVARGGANKAQPARRA